MMTDQGQQLSDRLLSVVLTFTLIHSDTTVDSARGCSLVPLLVLFMLLFAGGGGSLCGLQTREDVRSFVLPTPLGKKVRPV